MTIRAAILGFLILLAVGALGQAAPVLMSDEGAFAFSDKGGARLLVTSEISQPERLRTAICERSGRVEVEYESRQQGSEGGTGRDTPENFGVLAGTVFRLVSGKLNSGETCFLPSDSLVASANVVPVRPRNSLDSCSPDIRRQISSARGRDVVNCRPIAGLPADKRLVLAEFARQGKDSLAAVTLLDGNRAIFADYSGTYRGEGEDVWRVGDGGLLSASDFSVVFLLQRGDSYVLGIDWSAEEGASLAVFVSDSRSRFKQVIKDYWYRAPL